MFIDNPDNKPFVDHIDGDKQNNHVSNLRFCTNQENARNTKISIRNTSNVKGVSYDNHAKKYRARIKIDGISINLGLFSNIEDAKKARIKKVNEVYGEFVNACEKQ